MSEQEFEKDGLDRRSLIKRAGIVTAGVAAWSTPSVTSLATKAFAAGSPSPGCPSCGIGDDTCFGQVDCGGGCLCSAKVDGSGCVCATPTFCDNPLCSSDADCPSGTYCLSTCCLESRCFVPCDGAQGFAATRLAVEAPENRSSAPTKG